MSWKFWGKKNDKSGVAGAKSEKLTGPKELPYPVGKYLVVKLGQEPDWVWQLKSVARERQERKDTYDVRVFSDNDASMRKVSVKNYHSLDDHPELILFEGWFDKKTNEAHLETKEAPRTTPRAA